MVGYFIQEALGSRFSSGSQLSRLGVAELNGPIRTTARQIIGSDDSHSFFISEIGRRNIFHDFHRHSMSNFLRESRPRIHPFQFMPVDSFFEDHANNDTIHNDTEITTSDSINRLPTFPFVCKRLFIFIIVGKIKR